MRSDPQVDVATYDPFADHDEPAEPPRRARNVRSVTSAVVRSATSTNSSSTDIERRPVGQGTGSTTDKSPGSTTDKALVGVRTSCVRVVIIVFASGRVMRLVKDCDLWGCSRCSRRKAKAIATRLEAVLDGGEAHAADLTVEQWKAASKKARRCGVGYVGVKRPDDTVLILAGAPLAGRGWWLRPTAVAGVVDRVLSAPVRRVDWCALWRPSGVKRERTDPMVWRGQVPPSQMQQVFERAGFASDIDYVDCSPVEAGIRMGHALMGGGL